PTAAPAPSTTAAATAATRRQLGGRRYRGLRRLPHERQNSWPGSAGAPHTGQVVRAGAGAAGAGGCGGASCTARQLVAGVPAVWPPRAGGGSSLPSGSAADGGGGLAAAPFPSGAAARGFAVAGGG